MNWRLAIFFVLLAPAVTRAHVGSPNVFFEGHAGEYPVRVAIRPPAVLPGTAQVDVRFADGLVTNVSIEARVFGAGEEARQPIVRAAAVRGDTNLFNGAIWLMLKGSYSVDVTAEGSKGAGKVSVPLNSAALQAPVMRGGWQGVLIGIGVLLFLGAVGLAGAAARDYGLDEGALAPVRDKRRGYLAAVVTALVLGGGIIAGKARWQAMDRDFRSNALNKPSPVLASTKTNAGMQFLHLENARENTALGPTWENLAADHGKLMHLFLLKEPGYEAFAHLHPVRRDGHSFESIVPPLPAGRYDLYAEITYDNGANETLVTNIELNAVGGAAPQMNPMTNSVNDVLCQSGIIPTGNAAAPIALDADDSWHVARRELNGLKDQNQALMATAGSPNLKFCRLMGGASMVYEGPTALAPDQETSLRFSLFDADGKPVSLEPYMGMLGHAVVRRMDGTVFTHLHPMGTISMAAQTILAGQQRDPGTNLIAQSLSRQIKENAVSFPYAFPRGGEYRVWVQVRVSGRVLTGVFDLTVKG